MCNSLTSPFIWSTRAHYEMYSCRVLPVITTLHINLQYYCCVVWYEQFQSRWLSVYHYFVHFVAIEIDQIVVCTVSKASIAGASFTAPKRRQRWPLLYLTLCRLLTAFVCTSHESWHNSGNDRLVASQGHHWSNPSPPAPSLPCLQRPWCMPPIAH